MDAILANSEESSVMNFNPSAAHVIPEANLALTLYRASLRRDPADLDERRRGTKMAVPHPTHSVHQRELLRSTGLYQRFSRAIIATRVWTYQ
ncbi:hypothetical protein N7527_010946 [Penicillium freii]|uniref:Uncharacterized protein n=1 Tax=Penicillium freii TaxID=48697 RepID=A0A101MA85_PENFR|nr:hypothetical protein N7527_010946 [Penicillium freii]KUM56715.1 hypothetical protein ACN42_g10487 [Penicillium freii]